MAEFSAPVDDMHFVINELVGLETLRTLPNCSEITSDLITSILEEAGKFGAEILAPLNQSGDIDGCVLENGIVRTPSGFKSAYSQYIQSGWNGLTCDQDYGGQDLPWLIATAVSEIYHSANTSFMLNPMLTQGAIELLAKHGSDELKADYMEKLVYGTWTGTMNLTEPNAGSDLGRIQTKAVPMGDHYRITGTKIYITFGEHDLSENIIHMVLARVKGAPEGVRGISLFVVPKFLIKNDKSLGKRNDLRCISIEEKLGIHASPTAVMSYGDDGGAIGYLVGEENMGINYMFTMMNNERLAVGLQGVGISERAYQHAFAYAKERVQGRKIGGGRPEPVVIMEHPDVRRMLLDMKSQTEATRALAYYVAAQLDIAERHQDGDKRTKAQNRVDLLTPVVKAWGSDTSIDVASTGIQIHGGMGFIEETGAAQFYRDARITAIYEGTNGIQANDLVGRKIGKESGETVNALIAEMRSEVSTPLYDQSTPIARIQNKLCQSINDLEVATDWVIQTWPENPALVSSTAVPYLRLLALICSGWLMFKAYNLVNDSPNTVFRKSKHITVRFFIDHHVIQSRSLTKMVTEGATVVQDSEF